MSIKILSTLESAGREVIIADKSYYVATTGADTNNGLSVASPFLTIQKAIDTACMLDLSIYKVTINVADGAYENIILKQYSGGSEIHIKGNETTPSSVTITASTAATDAIKGEDAGIWRISGVKLISTNAAVTATGNTMVKVGIIDCGVCTETHFAAEGGTIEVYANYAISGASNRHINSWRGFVSVLNTTVTITNTPAFAYYFLATAHGGIAHVYGTTFSGSATGKRYDCTFNGVCFVNGAGTSYLPGSVAGTTATGGQYA